MKTGRAGLLAVALGCFAVLAPAGEWHELRGPYLGQTAPGETPEVFAPGIISHGFHELGITFSPDGKEIFYIMSDSRFQSYVLLHLDRHDGRWSEPKIAEFAAQISVYSVSYSPDGETLFFTGRPPAGSPEPREEHDIFRVRKENGVWGDAENIGSPVNTEGVESSVSVAANGTLYFSRDNDEGSSDLWAAEWDGDRFSQPNPLGAPINSPKREGRPCIAPDQNVLPFHSNREGSLGSNDLFFSARQSDGSWGEPLSLGATVNSASSEFGPSLSPDGRFIFFSSFRGLDPGLLVGRGFQELLDLYRLPANGFGTLYWVSAEGLLPSSPEATP